MQQALAITASGRHSAGDTRLSRVVIQKFLKYAGGQIENGAASGIMIHADHEIPVPVGYGLGCSGAVALSLAYALDGAFGTQMSREEIGKIAHISEIQCRNRTR